MPKLKLKKWALKQGLDHEPRTADMFSGGGVSMVGEMFRGSNDDSMMVHPTFLNLSNSLWVQWPKEVGPQKATCLKRSKLVISYFGNTFWVSQNQDLIVSVPLFFAWSSCGVFQSDHARDHVVHHLVQERTG